MPFQLIAPKNSGWGIGTSWFFISPIDVAMNGSAAGSVMGVVRVVEAEALQGAEMNLGSVEPTGICRCQDEDNVVWPCEVLETVVPMGRQVVLSKERP